MSISELDGSELGVGNNDVTGMLGVGSNDVTGMLGVGSNDVTGMLFCNTNVCSPSQGVTPRARR